MPETKSCPECGRASHWDEELEAWVCDYGHVDYLTPAPDDTKASWSNWYDRHPEDDPQDDFPSDYGDYD